MDSGSMVVYLADRLPELWLRTGEHLMLTGCSTSLAIIIGVPVGIFIFRTAWLRPPVMGSVGILQTIPSLAMLVFLLALLQKIGAAPALIALTLYALLPIVRNTLAGLEGVSHELIEAARGIGMTDYQELKLVRIPLSAPYILAGIRTAAVVGVGIATLSAFIGAGGLGQFINRGLALSDTKLILLGAIPAGLLALAVDFSIGAFEWALRPERIRDKGGSPRFLKRLIAFTLPFILILTGILSYFTKPSLGIQPKVSSGTPKRTIKIGSKNFTEQLILGEIMAQLIEEGTDLVVDRRFNLGGTMICHGALVNGEIDLYAEYTGTALTAILNTPKISDPEEAFQFVAEAYSKQFGLKWLRPFGFNNTYAITVRADDAKSRGWERISDLQDVASGLCAGFTAEFVERPDGYQGISKTYGLTFGEIRDLDPSLMYKAIFKGEVDVICAFVTDGRILSYNLMPLKDDRQFFPPYYAAPVVREETLEKYPKLQNTLASLNNTIDYTTMQKLNFEVDGKRKSPEDAAKMFLRAKGLLESSQGLLQVK